MKDPLQEENRLLKARLSIVNHLLDGWIKEYGCVPGKAQRAQALQNTLKNAKPKKEKHPL